MGVWCFHIDRRNIERAVRERMKSQKKRRSRTNIHKSFDSYWFPLFKGEPTDFAARFRAELSDIVIEADADMRQTVKNWKIEYKHKGRTYELSDAVAWFNQKGVRIQNCRDVDLRGPIMEGMERHLSK